MAEARPRLARAAELRVSRAHVMCASILVQGVSCGRVHVRSRTVARAEGLRDDLAEDEDEMSVRSDRSSFSLGAVNDLEKDLYEVGADEDRQVAGDELVSHTSKWHKHTVRVYGMLKRNMASRNADSDDEEEVEKPSQLSYNKLSAGCSRRTAAGVFFEMLQLKTWDFVELNQDKSYGDIAVAPGTRFDEDPPSASD